MALTKEQEKLKQLIKGDLDSIDGKRRKLKEKISARKRMYDSELPMRQYAGRANIRIPFPYTWVQSMLPRYMGSIFGGTDVMDAYPRIGADYEKAQNVKRLINFMLLFEMDFFWEAFAFFLSVSRAGIGIQKIRWEDQRQTCSIHTIDPLDFCIDPRAARIDKAAWIAHKVGKTKEELQQGVAQRGYIAEAVQTITQGEPEIGMIGEPYDRDKVILPKERQSYPCYEWWGKADIGPEAVDGGIDMNTGQAMPAKIVEGIRPVIALYCNNQLISMRSSPYGELVPFVSMADVPDAYSFYDAKCELDTIESMYEAASDILNQRMDNVTLNINGMWTYRKNSGLNLSKLVSSPWGLIGVGDHDDLKRWDTQNVTQNSYQEIGSLMDIMKLSTGLQDALRGVNEKGVTTASGMDMVLQQSGMRPGLKMQMAQYLYLKRIGEMVLQEAQMFMSEDKAVAVIGNPQDALPVIRPDGIAGQYEIMPRGFALAENKQSRLGNLNNTLNLLRGTQDPSMIPVIKLVIKEILTLEDIRFPEGLLDAPPPAAPIDPQKQVAMQNIAQAIHKQISSGPAGSPGVAAVSGARPPGPSAPMPPAGAPPMPRVA